MRIQWTEVSRYVALGFLEWEMLVGQPVINKKYGPGAIVAVNNDRYFSVDFEDGSRRCFSFYVSLDYFAPLTLTNQLAHKIHLISLSRQATEITIECTVTHPKLADRDLRLALLWGDHGRLVHNQENLIPMILHGNCRQDEEISRLLSARAAELAVMEFYREHGFNVEDISVQQALSPQSDEWKTHDLKINGYPVDVKNSRRSERNQDVYVEHCVPKFKQSRQGKNVAIVGVLSPYLWPDCIADPQTAVCPTSLLILGATQWRRLSGLKAFEKSGVLQIDLPRLGSTTSFLAPWVFEFGSVFYRKRDELLRKAQRISIQMNDFRERGSAATTSSGSFERKLVPMLIASGVTFEDYWNEKSFQAWERDFIRKIGSWRNELCLSLPYLYCTILTHFLETVASDQISPDYSPEKYRPLLFFDGSRLKMPLFIFDPLETVDALITTLTTLWNRRRDIVRNFRVFRLRGLNILQGKSSVNDPQWKTLVAYCGGLREERKCGFSPLILGDIVDGKRVELCPCGKLICPKCGFCMQNCKHR